MEVIEAIEGRKVYDVSVNSTLPSFLSGKSRKELKRDAEFSSRVELLQDAFFPSACSTLEMSRDGNYMLAAGVYKPHIKVYDLHQLGQKYEQYVDYEVVRLRALEDDYRKIVLLRADRTLEFHAHCAKYHTMRVPRFGRDMFFDDRIADLYVCGQSPDVYRLNLEAGQFLAPFETSHEEVNVVRASTVHSLVGTGGTGGIVQMFDPRQRAAVGSVDLCKSLTDADEFGVIRDAECTALAFGQDGLKFAAGTSSGHCAVYDLRSSKPLQFKEHPNGDRIVQIQFHAGTVGAQGGEGAIKIVSADRQQIKAWEMDSGKAYLNIELPAPINDFLITGPSAARADGGLFIVATESPKMHFFYAPTLGSAPKWCAFLDHLTEEMEEERTRALVVGDEGMGAASGVGGAHGKRTVDTLFADFKFLTEDEVARLGLTHLIGSRYLRPYLHGFFIDAKLYQRVHAAVDPFAYEQYEKEKLQRKIDAERSSRIAPLKKVRKKRSGGDTAAVAAGAVDARFARAVEDPAFKIDRDSDHFVEMQKRKEAMERELANLDEDEVNDLNDTELRHFTRAAQAIAEDSDDEQAVGGDGSALRSRVGFYEANREFSIGARATAAAAAAASASAAAHATGGDARNDLSAPLLERVQSKKAGKKKASNDGDDDDDDDDTTLFRPLGASYGNKSAEYEIDTSRVLNDGDNLIDEHRQNGGKGKNQGKVGSGKKKKKSARSGGQKRKR